jgi:enoyl-CoA hydratase/carnithine racemase
MVEAVQCLVDPNKIARITLDEPNSRANTLHRGVWEQLGAACRKLADRGGLQGLILQSAKPGIFVAGADLREIANLPMDDPEPTRALVRRGREVLAALEALPFPTIAAIDGAALGGGFELALACDFRLAGTNPKLKVGLPEVKLGLIPGWGGTQRPARIVGLSKAAGLVCTGETQSAESARALGLIDVIADSQQLDAAAVKRIQELSTTKQWPGLRAVKQGTVSGLADLAEIEALIAALAPDQQPAGREALRVVRTGAECSLHDALQIEEDAFVPLVASENARRLIGGFLKR